MSIGLWWKDVSAGYCKAGKQSIISMRIGQITQTTIYSVAPERSTTTQPDLAVWSSVT